MPGFKATLLKFEFKRKEYSKAFSEGLFRQARQAAREFARAAIERVPIRTGFARGALRNLNTAIGTAAASDPIAFVKREKKKFGKEKAPDLVEYYYGHGGKVLKTPENARRYSTQPGKVFTLENGVLYFNYNVTVLYYIVNEHTANSKIRNTPWESFKFGQDAFLSYLKTTGVKKLPAIRQYIVKTEVVVDRNNVSKGKSSNLDVIT